MESIWIYSRWIEFGQKEVRGHFKYNLEIPNFYDTTITTTAYASKFHRDWAKAAEYHSDVNQTDGGTKFYKADTVCRTRTYRYWWR